MVALDLAGIHVEGQRGVGVEVVARTVVRDPRRRIPGAPVRDVLCGIQHAGDPDRATTAFVSVALPRFAAGLVRRWNGIRAPQTFSALGVERAHRTADTELTARVADED